MTSILYQVGTLTTLLDNTGSAPNTLASLAASGGGALSSTIFDNTPASGTAAFWGDFEFNFTYGSSPTAGQTIDLYIIVAADGSNYADATGSNTPGSVVAPSNAYVGSIAVRGINTQQRLVLRGIPLPPLKFKVLVVNNGGQALATSGTTQTLKILPYYEQAF